MADGRFLFNDQREVSAHFIRKTLPRLALWPTATLGLLFTRALFILIFFEQHNPTDRLRHIGRCLAKGLIFDISTASAFTLPVFVSLALSHFFPRYKFHNTCSRIVTHLFCLTLPILVAIDIGYIREFHNQFDHRLLGLIFDDRKAIAITVWKTYPIAWTILCSTMTYLGVLKVFGWMETRLSEFVGGESPTLATPLPLRALPTLLLFGLTLGIGFRGSIGPRPIQLKDAAVTGDSFLDNLVLNPFSAIRYSASTYLTLTDENGLQRLLPSGDIFSAAKTINSACHSADLDSYLERTARGLNRVDVNHVVLVIMESYDAWPLKECYSSLKLTENLKRIGRDGVLTTNFLPSGSSTISSFTSIICGLPDVNIHPNYRLAGCGPLPTSIATAFKRLGYNTRLFYGGYLSWQRLGEFSKEQGFNEVYGGSEMHESLSGNEWGVDDDVLFDFVLKSTKQDTKTFDVILTTSYPPPFTANLN